MKNFLIAMVLLLVVGTIAAPLAMAEAQDKDKPIFSITPYVGWGLWSEDMGTKDSVDFGGHIAFHFLRWLSVEGTYGYSPSKRSSDDMSTGLTNIGLDLLVDFMPGARVSPYVFGGWGQIDYKRDDMEDPYPMNGYEFGGGVKAKIGGVNNANYRALRFEVRDVVTDLNRWFPNEGENTHNLIASVGLQLAFGTSHKDTDGDGIRDVNDVCPDTPMGAVVDPNGCPLDGDGDGVFDGLDQCTDTPKGATVDADGCPTDTDGDGVLDGIDQCPDTPMGAIVDKAGCPKDSDGDGVYDGLDKCPDTPKNLMVTEEGCPIAVTKTEIELLDTGSIVTSQIAFASSSADLDRHDNEALKVIGETLSRWPELKIEIGGHTDSTGSEAFNQKLSEQRAQSVLDYLVANYPDIRVSQFTVVGYGEAYPVANNETVEGRAQNRRVEFKVLNTETLKKEIENRRMKEK